MLLLSATDLAIATADKAGTLRLVELPSRLGGHFISIEDDRGCIEVALSKSEADLRVFQIRHAAREQGK